MPHDMVVSGLGRLCLLMGMAIACGATIALIACIAGASTTRVDGDWCIDGDTALANGTWYINGSLTVGTGTLRLEGAELIFTSPSQERVLLVDSPARVVGRDSVIRGAEGWLRVEVHGAAEFINCSFSHLSGTGISSAQGKLVLERCDLSDGNTLVSSSTTLRMSGCTLEGFWHGVSWQCSGAGAADLSVMIEDSTFAGGSVDSIDIVLGGPETASVDWDVTVRGCTLLGARYPIVVNGFTAYGNVTVENNTAEDCTHGAWLRAAGTAVRLSGNTWAGNPYEAGLNIEVASTGAPTILNETILGGSCGLSVSGGSEPVSVLGLRVDGSIVGVACSAAHVDLREAWIVANSTDFTAEVGGCIHLHDCEHSRRALVQPWTKGEVRELVPLRIDSVSWQDGSPAYGYEVLFSDPDTGFEVGRMEFPVPRTVDLTSWLVDQSAISAPKRAWGVLADPDWWHFYSDPFAIGGAPSIDLVVYDRSSPIVLVYKPSTGSLHGGSTIEVSGEVWDYGTGMGSVLLRIDLGDWGPPETVQGRYWSTVLKSVPDGTHLIEVLATDRAGNENLVSLCNVTMDSTPPFIQISSPAHWVKDVSALLAGVTEVGTRVTVNGASVHVDGEGNFMQWVGLVDGPNALEIVAIDRIRNYNSTIYTVVLDTVAPVITIERPGDGSWTWSSSIDVAGGTDEETCVTVNDMVGGSWSHSFYVTINGTEGLFPIEVAAVDRAGNAAARSVVVHIDQTPPSIDIATPADGLVTSDARMLTVGRVHDAGPVNLTVQGDPVDLVAGSWSAWIDLIEGWNVISVIAEDAAGNRASRTLRVLLDTEAPRILASIDAGPDVVPGPGGVLVTGLRTVDVLVVVYEWGVLRVTGRDDIEVGPGESEVPVGLSPGRNSIGVNFTDLAGNVAEGARIAIVLDVVPPELHLTSPKDGSRTTDATMGIVGETEPGASLTVNGEPVEVNQTGRFSAHVHLDMGESTISLTATDRWGNAANLTVRVERMEAPSAPQERQGAGLSLAAGLVVGVLAVLVVLLARTRGRKRPAVPRGGGDAPPGGTAGMPGGIGVRVRRGR